MTTIITHGNKMKNQTATTTTTITTTRTLLTTTPDKMDLVICHYEEDLQYLAALDWKSLIHQVFIYHKGDPTRKIADYHFPSHVVPKNVTINWICLKNVGREGHTIAYHCLQLCLNCNLGGSCTLFIQGGWDAAHANSAHVYPISQWNKYLIIEHTGYHCAHPGERYTNTGMIRHHSKWLKEKEEGQMKSTQMSMKDVYFFLTRKPFPVHIGIMVSYGNYFSVRNCRIVSHHPQFYQRWIALLETHTNPETGHYIERLTRHFFAGTSLLCVYVCVCCLFFGGKG